MKWFEYRFHKLFLMPNPTTYGLNARKVQEVWLYYGIASTTIIILLFAWYYWLTKPDLKALNRFKTMFLGFLTTPVWAAVPLFYTNPQKHINKFVIFMSSWGISIINVLLIYLSVIIILMILSQFPCGNLKAMRKYPFSWIP